MLKYNPFEVIKDGEDSVRGAARELGGREERERERDRERREKLVY